MIMPESTARGSEDEALGEKALVRVAIGILARNEAERLEDLLHDLSRQTILNLRNLRVTLALVANGCSDSTAEIGRAAFKDNSFVNVTTGVHEIEQAGKSNAWNIYVHSIVPGDTDFVIFLDGDIRIPEIDALESVLTSLMQAPEAVVAVDRSMKDLEFEQPRSWSEWLIKKATGTANDTRLAIAGALYCARFDAISPIWLPIGLPGEDGFIRAMLLTSGFEHEERINHLVFVESAYHIFESMRHMRCVIRHNVRLAIGTAVNILLFHDLRRIRAQGEGIYSYIKRRNDADPAWVNSLIAEQLQRGYFPLQPSFLLRRLREPKNRASLRRIAIALFGTAFDVVVFAKATRLMRKGAGAGYW